MCANVSKPLLKPANLYILQALKRAPWARVNEK